MNRAYVNLFSAEPSEALAADSRVFSFFRKRVDSIDSNEVPWTLTCCTDRHSSNQSLERLVAMQLVEYLWEWSPPWTAVDVPALSFDVDRPAEDRCLRSNAGDLAMLTMLDLTTSVDHDRLLQQFRKSYGLTRLATVVWFASCVLAPSAC